MKFQTNKLDQTKIETISKKFNISHALSEILLNRSLDTNDKIDQFLNPDIKHIKNPYLMSDMDKAVRRIQRAIHNKENVLIYGDKDVDGQTSVVLIKKTLTMYGLTPHYFVPFEYGVSTDIINFLKEKQISLLITVDCGIRNIDEIKTIQETGVDVIITDHHEVGDSLPSAVAAVNPKRKDCKYNFPHFSGCAVTFMLGIALVQSFDFYYNKEIVCLDIQETQINVLKMVNGIINEQITLNKNEIEKIHSFINKDSILLGQNISLSFLNTFLKKEITNVIIDISQILKQTACTDNLISYAKYLKINIDSLKHVEILALTFWATLFHSNVNVQQYINTNIDLVAFATISDIVPLLGINRTLVKYGINILNKTQNHGLQALIENIFSPGETINTKNIAWQLAPIINSCGRMKKPEVGIELMLSENINQANHSLSILLQLNKQRKKLQEKGKQAAEQYISKHYTNIENEKTLVIASPDIDQGISGIVASQISRKYKKPCFAISVKENICIASGRDTSNTNILSRLEACSDLLVKFGGHRSAVGFTINTENIQNFKQKLDNTTEKTITKTISIDLTITKEHITEKFLSELNLLEPFGHSNEIPIILIKDPILTDIRLIGSEKNHIKANFVTNTNIFDTVGWHKEEIYDDIFNAKNVVFKINKDTYSKNPWKFEILGIISA